MSDEPPLKDLQQRIADSVLSGRPADPALTGGIRAGEISAEDRLRVYRNNFVASLIQLLRTTYPVLNQLIGADRFAALARGLIDRSPPPQPHLAAWGAEMAPFLEGFAPLKAYPYLSAVARVEWARQHAYFAADAEAMAPEALAALPPDQLPSAVFTPLPSLTVVLSAHPVGSIWQLHQSPDTPKRLPPDAGPEAVIVWRPDMTVLQRTVSSADGAMLADLAAGMPLGSALETAEAEDRMPTDLQALLGQMLGDGLMAAVRPAT